MDRKVLLFNGPPWGLRIRFDNSSRTVKISQLITDGCAEKCGLKLNDTIKSVNNKPIGNVEEAQNEIQKSPKQLLLTINRMVESNLNQNDRREEAQKGKQETVECTDIEGSNTSNDLQKRKPDENEDQENFKEEEDIILEEDTSDDDHDSKNMNPLVTPNHIDYQQYQQQDSSSHRANEASSSSHWQLNNQSNVPPTMNDVEVPKRRNVAALRQVINDRLEMKTPTDTKPSWISNVKVYEPNGYIDPHSNKHNMGRVLDGPVNPTKYFQGVPPPSYNQVESKPPAPPPKPAVRAPPNKFNDWSKLSRNPYEYGGDPRIDPEIDDSASMISSCISTFGDSSEVAAISAAGSQRHLYDQYQSNLASFNNSNNNKTPSPPEESIRERSEAATIIEKTPNRDSTLFSTDIQLTPFGQSNIEKPEPQKRALDLESSELLVKSKSPAPYNSNNADHYATIRRRHTPVRMESEDDDKRISKTDSIITTIEQPRNYDSGYEGSNAMSPDQYSSRLDKTLSDAFELASTVASSMNIANLSENESKPQQATCMINESQNNIEDPIDPFCAKRPFHAQTEPEMSLWYRKMFKQMHKPENDEKDSKPIEALEKLDHFNKPTAEIPVQPQAASTPVRVEFEITPSRARSVGRIIEPEETKKRANLFAIERSKTVHFHVPPIKASPRCRCSKMCNIAFDDADKVYQQMNKHLRKDRKRTNRRIELRQIADKLDETTKELDVYIGRLEETWKRRSKSQPVISLKTNKEETPEQTNIGSEIEELKRLSTAEAAAREQTEKLAADLDSEKHQNYNKVQHSYIPTSAATSLQDNMSRFDGLIRDYTTNQNRSLTNDVDTISQANKGNVVIATAIYNFDARSPRELPLNRGDIIRIIREVDQYWIEGERNGRSGIFPASYVQIDAEHDRSRPKIRAVYPFTARNPNELNLKMGEVLTYRREIDSHWIEGTNQIGQIGIFPSSYVRLQSDEIESEKPFENSSIPARPKTPKVEFGASRMSIAERDDNMDSAMNYDKPSTNYQKEFDQYSTMKKEIPNSRETKVDFGPLDDVEQCDMTPSSKAVKFVPKQESTHNYQIDLEKHIPKQSFKDEIDYQPRKNQFPPNYEPMNYYNSQPQQNDYEQRRSNRNSYCGSGYQNSENQMVLNQPKTDADIRSNAASLIPKGSETFRALFDYHPQKDDELELRVNDIIFVVEKCEDGWFIGTSIRTGEFGIFPGNYVQRH